MLDTIFPESCYRCPASQLFSNPPGTHACFCTHTSKTVILTAGSCMRSNNKFELLAVCLLQLDVLLDGLLTQPFEAEARLNNT
jgi:hypothetical protein